MQHAYKPRLYEQLETLPEGLTGEILNGQLHSQPRPAGPHALTESNLQIEIGGPFGKGRGGPGGWWILVELEIHFVTDQEVVVPDLAGWRRGRDSSVASPAPRQASAVRAPADQSSAQGSWRLADTVAQHLFQTGAHAVADNWRGPRPADRAGIANPAERDYIEV